MTPEKVASPELVGRTSVATGCCHWLKKGGKGVLDLFENEEYLRFEK